MHTFLQAYFWFMVVYLLATAIGMLVKSKKIATAHLSASMWGEQLASYALLIVGLVGVYGYIHATPFLFALFWQAFLVIFASFAALQHRMPKTRLLRETHGPNAVVIASVVGVLLLLPMFLAISIYGFGSATLWS
ncbi:MAG: hypothetical protein AB7Q97_26075 [Gammaproteobacteria bacterium]